MNITPSARLCLQLAELDGFGLKLLHTLAARFGGVSTWHNQTEAAFLEGSRNHSLIRKVHSCVKGPRYEPVPAMLAWLEHPESCLISYFDDAYPAALKQINLPPALLYLEGDASLLHRKSIAIVGSRKPSSSYARLAQDLAFNLAKNDWSVVSGMALGIDTEAHMGALAAQGSSVAVMATGIDVCYPKRNQALQQELLRKGLVVTEMPIGSPPLKQHFPRRNRIVSGLCSGVVVVEAGIKSGSLITARYALEQNREVYAVPGSPAVTSTQGCNYLIREGARLVSSSEQLLEDLGELPNAILAPTQSDPIKVNQTFPKEHHDLLIIVGHDIVGFDEIYAQSVLSFSDLSEALLELELANIIASTDGGYQRVS